jgi:hypothetical protein
VGVIPEWVVLESISDARGCHYSPNMQEKPNKANAAHQDRTPNVCEFVDGLRHSLGSNSHPARAPAPSRAARGRPATWGGTTYEDAWIRQLRAISIRSFQLRCVRQSNDWTRLFPRPCLPHLLLDPWIRVLDPLQRGDAGAPSRLNRCARLAWICETALISRITT